MKKDLTMKNLTVEHLRDASVGSKINTSTYGFKKIGADKWLSDFPYSEPVDSKYLFHGLHNLYNRGYCIYLYLNFNN